MEKEVPIMECLKQERKEQGVTQVELAKKIGMTQPQLSNLESATKSPSLKTIHRYAEGLGLEVRIEFRKRKE